MAGGGLLRRKTITSPDPSDTGDIINAEELGFISGTSCKMLPLLMSCRLCYHVHASIVKLRAYLLNVCFMELSM